MPSTRPTPREGRRIPSDAAIAALILLLGSVIACSLAWGASHLPQTEAEQRPEHVITHDSLVPTYTYDGEVIRWYVMVDPDTSVQYLVNDRGGCTPRLDQYGNIIGVQTWYESE